jgi:acid phosphatase
MGRSRVVAGSCLAFAATVFALFALLDKGMVPKRFLLYIGASAAADLAWYPPNQTWINNLSEVINGTGTHGFVFNSSVLPPGTPYGTYNWCNMPHVRREEYVIPDAEYKLEYVEVVSIHPSLRNIKH